MAETLGELNIDIKIDWKKVNRSLGRISTAVKKVSSKIKTNTNAAMKAMPRFAAVAAAKTKVIFAALSSSIKKDLVKIRSIFSSTFRSIVRIATRSLLAIGAAMAGFAIFGAKLAIDAKEVENLMEVSFGNMTKSAQDWVEAFAGGLGLFKPAIKQYVSTLNIMSRAMGLTDKQSFELSKNLTERAVDLASLRNLKIEDAFNKITAAISGESEPLKRLGFIINETTTKNFAFENGIAKVGEELSEAQKVLARYGLIMKLTANAQGDLAKTAKEPANQIKLLGERFKTAAAATGDAVINSDAFKKTITGLFSLIEKFQPKIVELVTLGFGKLDAFLKDDEAIKEFMRNIKDTFLIVGKLSVILFKLGKFLLLPTAKGGNKFLRELNEITRKTTVVFLLFSTVLSGITVVIGKVLVAAGLIGTVGSSILSTIAGLLVVATAAFSFFVTKGLLKAIAWMEETWNWFDKLTDIIDNMITGILKLVSLMPGMKKLLGIQADVNKAESKDIGSIMSRRAASPTANQGVPVASPNAIASANKGKGISAGEQTLIKLQKQLIQVTAGQPMKESLLTSNYSS